MFPTPDPILSMNKANLAAAINVVNIALGGAERLAQLNLQAARTLLEESAKNAKAIASATSLQDLVALQSNLTDPNVEKAVSYSRHLYQVASETQAAVSKVVEERVSEINSTLVDELEKIAKTAPAGSEAMVSMLKSGVAAANNAYDTLSKAAKQVVEVTEANVVNAAAVASKKKPAKAA